MWLIEGAHFVVDRGGPFCGLWLIEGAHLWLIEGAHLWLIEGAHLWLIEGAHLWLIEGAHLFDRSRGPFVVDHFVVDRGGPFCG